MHLSRLILIPVLIFMLIDLKAQQSIIAATGFHILYEGVPNPLFIVIDGIPLKDMAVSADNGIITGSNGEYNIEVRLGAQRTCTIKAGKFIGRGDTLWLQKQEFIIRPNPYL